MSDSIFVILHSIQDNPASYSVPDLWAALDLVRPLHIDPAWKAMLLRMLADRLA